MNRQAFVRRLHLLMQHSEQGVRRLYALIQHALARLGLPEHTLFVFSAILTGALAGLAAVVFHNAIEFFNELFFNRGRQVIGFLGSLHVILLPALGMLIQSGMIALWPEVASRKGVMEVIKAVALRGGYIPLRVTVFHFFASAICMGSGGTVGPEGPAAQIGAGVASRFGYTLGVSEAYRRIFTAAGSGAAIAAIFNTPLGGIFFALEIALLNDFHASTFSALILASVTASAISRAILGNAPAFFVGEVVIGSYYTIFLYGLLGLFAGALAVLFIRYSDGLRQHLKQLMLRWPRALVMSLAGLAVGAAGFFFSYDILGIGYEGINHVLLGETLWQMAVVLLLLKFVLVPLVLEAGGFGGTFAPSLFMGAMLGFLFAHAINVLTPVTGFSTHPGTFTLVGMGAMLAALNSVPLAAIMILFEMTNNYSFILPLMLGVVASTMVTHVALKESLYSHKLRLAGYRLRSGRDLSLLQTLSAGEVMRAGDVILLQENLPLNEAMKICIESPHESFYTIDARGRLTGTISTAELRQIITEYENLKASRVVAKDIAAPEVITVSEHDDLDQVLRLFGHGAADEFPVVSADDPHQIVGSIHRQDVINAYNKESLKHNLTEGVARNLRTLEKTGHVAFANGYSFLEKVAPAEFVGKTLAELRLRNLYGVEVIMIHPAHDPYQSGEQMIAIMPEVKYRIQSGDTLVLFGQDEKLREVERL